MLEQKLSSSEKSCGSGETFIPESELLANIDWVEANLKPYGYDMVAVQIPAGEREFKVASSQDWSKEDWGNALGFSGTVTPTTGGGPNVRISVPETASYRFEFNDFTLEYSLNRVETGT